MTIRKILIVEDAENLRFLLTKFLEKEGHPVLTASNGLEAIKAIRLEDDIGLVFLDIMMPKMNGIELLEKIKELKNDINLKVCMVTAKKNHMDVNTCLKLGADDYIVKPIDREILIQKTRILLHSKEQSLFAALKTKIKGFISRDGRPSEITINSLSENEINFESDFKFNSGEGVHLKSPKLQEIAQTTGPFFIRIFECIDGGAKYKIKANFMALDEDTSRLIRAVTIKGEELYE